MSAAKPLRAICLDGGGYLGLATASFLAELERHFDIKVADEFNLFCGTSTGGIIALALAHGKSAAEIVDLYKRLGTEVFNNKFPGSRAARILRGFFFARYSNTKLKEALAATFGDATLGDIKARGKYVIVPAFCLTTGTPRIFKTDHSPELTRDSGYHVRDIALATSAAPTYLPIATITSPTSGAVEQFIDGGVYANNPTLLAFTEGVGYLGRRPSELQILSVATPRDPRSAAERTRPPSRFERFRLSRGIFGWGPSLAELFIGSTMKLTHSAVTRVMLGLGAGDGGEKVGAYVRSDLPTHPHLGLDVADDGATQDLISIGTNAASQNDFRNRVRPLLTTRRLNHGEHPETV
ncbi:patatin-like phospholipase family protein [Myxococcus xanthus]|uniref:Patatin-like phospholipase family protein n=2 Tax=Myxococcus xanthus TaxID=34 RepID=A0A7Y4IP90_MYXXA|nr:patatin-like phospholipase family protein [Myxococcus xanthus]